MQISGAQYSQIQIDNLFASKTDNAVQSKSRNKDAEYRKNEAEIKAKNPILNSIPSTDEILRGGFDFYV